MAGEIGIAMVGCGQIAEAHLKAVDALDGANLVWCVDVVTEQAESAAKRYGALHWGSDYAEALACDDVDAVVLCLPHDLHLPFSVQASKAHKHVLVEKPMALNEAEAQEMVAAAALSGTQLMVGQSTRYMPAFQEAKKILDAGRIGRIFNVVHQRLFMVERVSTEWRKSQAECGGLYLPLFGSHDVDAILWLLNDQPARVWGSVRACGKATDGDSDGMIGLEFEDGKLASLAFSVQSKRVRTETVFVGEEGTLAIQRNQVFVDGEEIEISEQENAFAHQMRVFVSALQTEEPVPTSGQEVLRVMRTLDLVRQASERGKQMVF